MKFNAIQGSLLLVRANSMAHCGRHRATHDVSPKCSLLLTDARQ
jgi:hypothetical protein